MMSHWMFDCKEVTRRVSESFDRDLPLLQRMGIRFHLMMCKFCAAYKSQLLVLRQAIEFHVTQGADPETALTLSPEARERIRHALRQGTSKSPIL